MFDGGGISAWATPLGDISTCMCFSQISTHVTLKILKKKKETKPVYNVSVPMSLLSFISRVTQLLQFSKDSFPDMPDSVSASWDAMSPLLRNITEMSSLVRRSYAQLPVDSSHVQMERVTHMASAVKSYRQDTINLYVAHLPQVSASGPKNIRNLIDSPVADADGPLRIMMLVSPPPTSATPAPRLRPSA